MIQDELRPSDVKNGRTFATYCQQRFGTPYPTGKSLAILNRNAKKLFEQHPDTNWQTLVRVAQWCHDTRYRVAEVYQYVSQFRYAYAKGAIDLDPVAELEAQAGIVDALSYEDDPEWRRRLMRADGISMKLRVVKEWREERGGVCGWTEQDHATPANG